jgi:CRP/FNR family transcriptional regulator, cyclic AMP receptor protein
MTRPWAPRSLLASLGDETCERLLSLGVGREFPAGRRLISEGDESNHVEIITRGFVKIVISTNGLETLLAIRAPGDVVGESAGLTGQPRMATVRTCGPVTAVAVRHGDFKHFLTGHADVAIRLASMMGNRLRYANQRRADFATSSPETRLARVLVDLAHSCGRNTGAGVVFDIALTQQELASMVGVGEATVQRALRELRDRGLVGTGYRRVRLPDLAGLQAAAEKA